ncbi:3-succinoylsemialdehyde-pyridine dehydrogenase [Pararobbsia alpina]|uniref:aldehyde dehydrogenase family protein n=1 Tax=Pararobbsia alpina TaxID=621374 RepID=UPI0039A4702A
MRNFNQIYIDGQFVTPHGTEQFDLFDPTTGTVTGHVRLGDEEDARRAVAAARRAFPAFSQTSRNERIGMLRRLHAAMSERVDDLTQATIEEYGAPVSRAVWGAKYAAETFLHAITTLENYAFERDIASARVVMQPIGVVGQITPWNANAGFICGKLSIAIAAGCTSVLKPSEMSAWQTQIVMEALHEAGLPPGVFNIVNGRGDVVGTEITHHPDIAKVSFTGSTRVGKSILRSAADTMKRVTLELGGKSPTIVLDDADLAQAVPLILNAGFGNNGQACINGTRVLVPENRFEAFCEAIRAGVEQIAVGDPRDPATQIGPLVSRTQHERVQRYIRTGVEEGATLLTGGAERPDHLERGYFVKPTVFVNVTNDMTIAREEIFGPVICVMRYRHEEDAIAIANDTSYGLHAYVVSSDPERAQAVARRLDAGRVAINGAPHEPLAPFGGFKQSGIGREYGEFGLEACLEPKAILGMQRAA